MTRVVDAAFEEQFGIEQAQFSDASAENSIRVNENRTTSGIAVLKLNWAGAIVGYNRTCAEHNHSV
jgi:hypothetical protein